MEESLPSQSKADAYFISFNELTKEDQDKVLEKIQSSKKSLKRTRTIFEESFKEKAVNTWKENGNYLMTAKILNKDLNDDQEKKIHESYIRRWASEKLRKEEINQVKKKVKITKSKVTYPEMGNELLELFKIQREKNFRSL